MSTDFPLSLENLISVLEVIAPPKQKHFSKLKDFIQGLPNKNKGFPVSINIPIVPTVSGMTM